MNHASETHEFQDGARPGETPSFGAEMRAIPGFDHGTGRLTGVTLTRRPPQDGASIGLLAPRPDLDAALPPLPGWHWFEGRGSSVCELVPTTQEVLVQVAEDMFRETLGNYRMNAYGEPVDQLREAAARRMSLPLDEAEFQCTRLLREYQAHLRRIKADDED